MSFNRKTNGSWIPMSKERGLQNFELSGSILSHFKLHIFILIVKIICPDISFPLFLLKGIHQRC